MLPVQSWELDSARSEWATVLLTIPAQQRRPVTARTAGAGQTRTYVVIAEVTCYIEPGYPGEPRDLKSADGQVAQTYWSLSLPYTVEVMKDDQFIINAVTYEVVDTDATDDPDLTIEVVQLVRVQRLKGMTPPILLPNAIRAIAAVMPATLTVG
jgi:hypothetical protein